MKKIGMILIFLFFLSTVLCAAGQDLVETFVSGDWEYQENKTGWTITDYRGKATEIDIPEEFDGTPVTALGASLFVNDIELVSVSIPDSVTSIGKGAFQGCSNLTDVRLSFTLKALPEACFKYCTSLKTITLPLSLTNIGKEAFADCVRLEEIIVPSNVTTLGESAFENCQSLTDVYVSRKLQTVNANAFTDTPWFDAQTDEFVYIGGGVLLKYNGTKHNVGLPYGTVMISNAFEGNQYVESVTLPESVLRVGQYAFKDCVNLTGINIPKYVTTVSAGAFQNCRRLTQIELPETVTGIGADAFNGCERLTELIIPSKVTQIPARMAKDCPALTMAKIPEGVTKFDKTAFIGSDNVDIQIAPGSPAEELLISYEIPYTYYLLQTEDFIYSRGTDSVSIIRYIGQLYDVEIPAIIDGLPVTVIGTAAFQNDPIVRRVQVPITVKTIGEWAFSYMDSLEEVHLSFSVESLGANAFTGSPELWEIRVPNAVKMLGANVFDSGVIICAEDGSSAANALRVMGYTVSPMDACKSQSQVLDRWTEMNLNIGSACDCSGSNASGASVSYASGENQNINVIRIPDGMTSIEEALLADAYQDIILIIPPSVTDIPEWILTGHNVTIVGDPGSAAEQFALDHDLRFIVRVSLYIGE